MVPGILMAALSDRLNVRRASCSFPSAHLDGYRLISDNRTPFLRPKWRNWQTHWFQVPAPVRVSGFNSRLRHHPFNISLIPCRYYLFTTIGTGISPGLFCGACRVCGRSVSLMRFPSYHALTARRNRSVRSGWSVRKSAAVRHSSEEYASELTFG